MKLTVSYFDSCRLLASRAEKLQCSSYYHLVYSLLLNYCLTFVSQKNALRYTEAMHNYYLMY